jgi:signal transduction histidine kinase
MKEIIDEYPVFGLLDLIPNGIIVIRSDYSICYWNACMAEWTDIPADEAKGTNLIERYPALKNPIVYSRITQLFEGGPAVLFSSTFHPHLIPCEFPNGDLRVEKISFIPFRQSGRKYALVLIEDMSDLTNQIKAYRTMKAVAEDQRDDLKKAQDAIYLANKKLNLLNSITRHDINNQLTVQIGYLEILEDTKLDAMQNDYFLQVTTAAKRISSMIQFTKEYEKIGVNAPVWQDCRTLVDVAAREVQLGNVMVKNDLASGMDVFADPLIVKVFYNLMDNAVRYGGKITTIRFSVEDHHGEHIIVCEDDGAGVPADEREMIFERGFGKNTGLGLALSREILYITGITIQETGKPGKGARFEMTVPKEGIQFDKHKS